MGFFKPPKPGKKPKLPSMPGPKPPGIPSNSRPKPSAGGAGPGPMRAPPRGRPLM
jgi:hypothetical protein